MLNFDFHIPTRIIFGKGTHKNIGELLRPHAKKILLHYGGSNIKRSGLYDEVTSSLKSAGIEFVELGGVVPNPRLSLVEQGIELCRKEKVELVLAVGGGSVIDSSKAIAAGVYCDGDICPILENFLPIQKALPVAAILTIPASGSESSMFCVITNEETQRKMTYGNPNLRPLMSIVNPELFFTLPKNQIANGVADIMSHVMERYFTNTTKTDLTDGLCESTIKTVMKNGLAVYNNPSDYDAWCQVGFGGTLAHNDLLGLGRQGDWGTHNTEHELSAMYDVPHGAGLAVLTPAWMTYIYKEKLDMFVQFAVNVMGVEGGFREPEALALEGIARLRAFFNKLELPSTLTELGIKADTLEEMAKKASGAAYGREDGTIGFFRALKWQDILEIFKLAM